ncbi:MAG: hypothetical protein AB7S68_05920 [Polyangiaceae bacterium]
MTLRPITLLSIACLLCAACSTTPSEQKTVQRNAQSSAPSNTDDQSDDDFDFLVEPGDMSTDVSATSVPAVTLTAALTPADVSQVEDAAQLLRVDADGLGHLIATSVTYVPPGTVLGQTGHRFELEPSVALTTGWYVARLDVDSLPAELRDRLQASRSIGSRFRVGSQIMLSFGSVASDANSSFINVIFSSRVKANAKVSELVSVKANGKLVTCESIDEDVSGEYGVVGIGLKCPAIDSKASLSVEFSDGLVGLEGGKCRGFDGVSPCSADFELVDGFGDARPAEDAADASGFKVGLPLQQK